MKRKLEAWAEECKWNTVNDISPDRVTERLHAFSAKGLAPVTQNHHLGRLKEFVKFCVHQNWIERSAINNIRKAKVGRKGRRRLRRAYSQEEFQRIIEVAPEPRRTIYLIASLSGLRKNEPRQLEREDFTPTGLRPCWHLRADKEKSGRGDRIPMLPECAELILPLWNERGPRQRLFDSMPRDHTFRRDLEAAKVDRQDSRGRWVDFHSFRYFFCTMLARKGMPIQTVKTLMRHSTITLTADLYHDLGLEEEMESMASRLPRLLPIPRAKKEGAEGGSIADATDHGSESE